MAPEEIMTLHTNPHIDHYLLDGCGRCSLYQTPACKVHSWQAELKELRRIVLECGLVEELKWSQPTYTDRGKNILMVSALKNHAILAFFKGVLLKDKHNLLVAPGKNSQSDRQFRFTDVQELLKLESTIKAYILEAIAMERAGMKVNFKKVEDAEVPVELQAKLDEDPAFHAAFEALTPGRKRGYYLYFSQAKQSKTREARIEKMKPFIFEGRGWNGR